jgi:hypothetical protein
MTHMPVLNLRTASPQIHAVQSGQKVTSLDELQDIDELCVVEVRSLCSSCLYVCVCIYMCVHACVCASAGRGGEICARVCALCVRICMCMFVFVCAYPVAGKVHERKKVAGC